MREMGVIGAVVATSKLPNLGSDESVTWNFLNSSLYCLRQLQRGVLQSICKLEIWASWTPNKLNVKQTRNTFATRQSKQCEFSSWYIFWSVRVMGHLIRVVMVAQGLQCGPGSQVVQVVQVARVLKVVLCRPDMCHCVEKLLFKRGCFGWGRWPYSWGWWSWLLKEVVLTLEVGEGTTCSKGSWLTGTKPMCTLGHLSANYPVLAFFQ